LAARRTRGTWCRRVVASQDVTVPPRSQLDVSTKVIFHQLLTSTGKEAVWQPACDYVIQKTARSAPITVHRNKLKICYGTTPKSWLADPTQEVAREEDGRNERGVRQEGVSESSQPSEIQPQPVRRRCRRQQGEIDYGDGEVEAQRVLPRRDRRIPSRFEGFRM